MLQRYKIIVNLQNLEQKNEKCYDRMLRSFVRMFTRLVGILRRLVSALGRLVGNETCDCRGTFMRDSAYRYFSSSAGSSAKSRTFFLLACMRSYSSLEPTMSFSNSRRPVPAGMR